MNTKTALFQANLWHPMTPIKQRAMNVLNQSADALTRFKWAARVAKRTARAKGMELGEFLAWADACEQAAQARGMTLERWTAEGYTMEVR